MIGSACRLYFSENESLCIVRISALDKKKLFTEIPYLEGERVVLRALTQADAPGLQEMMDDSRVYRYLPTFLFEKKYADAETVIDRLYNECFQDSIILGVFVDNEFCGLAELYGYQDRIHKVSVGYRSRQQFWGKGIAGETLNLVISYLYDETDIEIITASTMVENQAVARMVEKNGFTLVVHAVEEDWGYDRPTLADKWIR